MTKPRITAAMLRKRPKPAPDASTDEAAAADSPSRPEEASHSASHESTLDNPMFRAPQFGIRPKVSAPAIHQQRPPRRRFGSEGA